MIIDISDLNDNEPRSPYEVISDQSYWTLRQNFTDIERDTATVYESFQRRAYEIVDYNFGDYDAPILLSLLSDYEVLLYPTTDNETIQLQVSAQILADNIISEHGLEIATKCMIKGFEASDELRSRLADVGETDVKLQVGKGLINILGQAFSDPRFSAGTIRNGAELVKDYLDDPAACNDPQWRVRLQVLSTADDAVKKPQATRTAPIINLAQARRSLRAPNP